MEDLLPILGISIPLVVVVGKFVIQPMAELIAKTMQQSRLEESSKPLADRMAATEERLERIERSLTRLVEEQEFRRELRSPESGSRAGLEGR